MLGRKFLCMFRSDAWVVGWVLASPRHTPIGAGQCLHGRSRPSSGCLPNTPNVAPVPAPHQLLPVLPVVNPVSFIQKGICSLVPAKLPHLSVYASLLLSPPQEVVRSSAGADAIQPLPLLRVVRVAYPKA